MWITPTPHQLKNIFTKTFPAANCDCTDLKSLRGRPDLDDLRHLLLRVGQRADDEQPVEQVARDAVRRENVLRAADRAAAAVRREHHDGRDRALQGSAMAVYQGHRYLSPGLHGSGVPEEPN